MEALTHVGTGPLPVFQAILASPEPLELGYPLGTAVPRDLTLLAFLFAFDFAWRLPDSRNCQNSVDGAHPGTGGTEIEVVVCQSDHLQSTLILYLESKVDCRAFQVSVSCS